MATVVADAYVAAFLRQTRGAPLACFVAMLMLVRPLGVVDLAGLTGLDRKSVTRALRDLELLGYAAQLGRFNSWRLTDKARQMPLPGLESLLATAIEGENIPLDSATAIGVEGRGLATAVEVEGEILPIEGEILPLARIAASPDGRTERLSPPSTDGSVVVVDLDPDLIRDQQQQQEQARGNFSPSREVEILQACESCGISGVKVQSLLAREWVTGDRVREAVRIAIAQGWSNPQGMAITRLEAHAVTGPPPARKPKPKNDRRDVGRQWADLINNRGGADEESDNVDQT